MAFATPFRNLLARSPLGQRLAGGAFWVFAGALVQRGLMMAAMVMSARLLGTERFGELGVIRNTTLMFTTIAGIGLMLTATRHVAQYRESDPERAGRIIGLSAAFAFGIGATGAVTLALFAPWFATTLFAAPHLDGLLRLGAVMLLFSALIAAQRGALSGFEAFRARSVVDLTTGLITFPAVVVGVLVWDLPGAVCGLVLSQALGWAISHVALRRVATSRSVPISLRGILREARLLWSFSLPATINSAMFAPVNWVAAVMLVNQPDGYEEMGLFNAAYQLFIALSLFPQLLGQVVLPMLSNLRSQGDRRRYVKLMRVAVAVNVGVLVLCALPLVALASPVMSIFGREFLAGTDALVVLALAATLLAASHVLTHSIVASGMVWVNVGINGLWAATLLAVAWTLRDRGALGLASAYAAAYGLRAVVSAIIAPIVHARTWSSS